MAEEVVQSSVAWEHVVPAVLAAGDAARRLPAFDEQARARHVEREIVAVSRSPWWLLAVAAGALALPSGAVWAGLAATLWAALHVRARRRGSDQRSELALETDALREGAAREATTVAAALTAADAGNRDALHVVLERWRAALPPALAGVALSVANPPTAGVRGWSLVGRGLARDEIPATVPRAGRGGRTVMDKRKAAEVDDDLVEVNAAVVLSALRALLGGASSQRVTVRLAISPEPAGMPIPWVTLVAEFGRSDIERVLASHAAPSEMVRALGGAVGRCRAQRYTAAPDPMLLDGGSPRPPAPPRADPPQLSAPTTPRLGAPTQASGHRERDVYGGQAAAVTFGGGIPPGEARGTRGGVIPPRPARLGEPAVASPAVSPVAPTPATVQGAFSTVARKFADYPGDPAARFVAFEQYWATYADMAPGQLRFYFRWRHAVRGGQAPRTDLSYVFVHVYELLHGVGAAAPADAARQLERLWAAYRGTYPQLDGYLVSWTADLLATEVDTPAALAWIERALAAGARLRDEEARVVLDRYWAAGDYAAMPRAALALLTGDPRLGDNKFCQQYNVPAGDARGGAGEPRTTASVPHGTPGHTSHDTDGWVDRVYRDALAVADRVSVATEGGTLHELAVRRHGLTRVTREAFQSAVYDWKRKPVTLGAVPALDVDSPAVRTYRNAVRYAENLLRAEKGFAAKLRGVEVSPALAAALDAHVAGYVAATRPRARVTIDLGRARELARQSEDVRARLLAGLDDPDAGSAIATTRSTPSLAEPVPSTSAPGAVPAPDVAPPADTPAGLLTDLAAVQSALAALTPPARRLLDALEARGWEVPAADPALVAAAGGALVAPLLDEINERAVDGLGDVLIVHEDGRLVLQDDFRDEVYWVLKGTLDGFGAATATAAAGSVTASAPASGRSAVAARVDTDGFGPTELRVLALLADPDATAGTAALAAYAAGQGTTPLLLLDRVNELALASAYGDLLVDQDAAPPVLYAEAASYVSDLLARVGGAPAGPLASSSAD